MTTLTLTRALSELTTLADRIAKAISNLEVIVVAQADIQSNNKKDLITKFQAQAKADFQSIEALIVRRNLIQKLLLKANSVTTVKIGDTSYTIAEAIAAKNNIGQATGTNKKTAGLEYALLSKLRQEQVKSRAAIEKDTTLFKASLAAYLTLRLGGIAVKDRDPKTVAELTEEFSKLDLPTVYEGIDVKAAIKQYDDYITFFLGEVDTALSEVNATTSIEIPD